MRSAGAGTSVASYIVLGQEHQHRVQAADDIVTYHVLDQECLPDEPVRLGNWPLARDSRLRPERQPGVALQIDMYWLFYPENTVIHADLLRFLRLEANLDPIGTIQTVFWVDTGRYRYIGYMRHPWWD